MKHQALFSSKDKSKKKIKCRLLQFLFGTLRVTSTWFTLEWQKSRQQNVFNSLTTEKQTTKFLSENFQKMLSPSYIILKIQRLEGKQCRSR